MQQRAEEQLQLHLGDLVAQTHPLPSSKWHEVLGFVEFTILCQESLRSEGFGLLPDLGVHVHAMQQRDDVRVFWNDMTIQLDSSVSCVGGAHGDHSGSSHDFVDGGPGVGE